MPVTVTGRAGTAVAALSGEIDHHAAKAMIAQLEEIIAARTPTHLVLDLSGVTFMDSSGIAVLLRTLRQMERLGGTLRVTAVPVQARRVLDAAGVGRLIALD